VAVLVLLASPGNVLTQSKPSQYAQLGRFSIARQTSSVFIPGLRGTRYTAWTCKSCSSILACSAGKESMAAGVAEVPADFPRRAPNPRRSSAKLQISPSDWLSGAPTYLCWFGSRQKMDQVHVRTTTTVWSSNASEFPAWEPTARKMELTTRSAVSPEFIAITSSSLSGPKSSHRVSTASVTPSV
jgi:hypothetical protein